MQTHELLTGQTVTEAAFNRQEQGFGLEVMYGTNIALAGGMRSGSSPPGLMRCVYNVIDLQILKQGDQELARIGLVEIFKDNNNDVRGLINIKLNKNNRRAGVGAEIVRSLVDTSPSDFTVWDIKKVAVGFWRKMGCEFYNTGGQPMPNPAKSRNTIVGLIRKPGSTADVTTQPGFPRRAPTP